MVSRHPRRIAVHRKSHVLRSLSSSKSVKKRAAMIDAFLYIHKLKLKLEGIEREYSNLLSIKTQYLKEMTQFLHPPTEVKVEKYGEEFLVKVRCEKDGDKLVSVLGTFDEMGLDVVQARVFSNIFFAMEAIVKAEDQELTEKILSQAINGAIGTLPGGNRNRTRSPE